MLGARGVRVWGCSAQGSNCKALGARFSGFRTLV